MEVLFLLVLIPICIADISSFKIPNIYSKYLFAVTVLILLFYGIGDLTRLLLSFLPLVLLSGVGLGMGDIKLIGVISLAFNNRTGFSPFGFVILALIYASAHILISHLRKGQMPQRIAFAPAISLAFATYCVTS